MFKGLANIPHASTVKLTPNLSEWVRVIIGEVGLFLVKLIQFWAFNALQKKDNAKIKCNFFILFNFVQSFLSAINEKNDLIPVLILPSIP
jgi:hypothetical protein